MVTVFFERGITSLALAQKASSVGWTSGSPRSPARICLSVKERSRFQLVRGSVTFLFEVLPVIAALMRFRSPCCYKVPFFVFTVRVDDRDLKAIHQADHINARLGVVKAVIDSLHRGAIENMGRVPEGYSMAPHVNAVLLRTPGESHPYIYKTYLHLSRVGEAPYPDRLLLTRGWGQTLPPQRPRLTGHYDLRRIDGLRVQLHLDHLAVLIDQVVHPPRGLVFRVVDAVLLGRVAAPIAKQREGDANFFRPRLVREGRIHAHTQHLGIGSFQLGEVLLESLHLLGSTTGEGEDVERQGDVLLPFEIMQRNLVSALVLQGEIRRHVAHLDLGRRGLARLVGCLARSQK